MSDIRVWILPSRSVGVVEVSRDRFGQGSFDLPQHVPWIFAASKEPVLCSHHKIFSHILNRWDNKYCDFFFFLKQYLPLNYCLRDFQVFSPFAIFSSCSHRAIGGFLRHGPPWLIFQCCHRAREATSHHPSILTTSKHFQYVGSLITSIVWKTKWREMIIGTKRGGCKSSNQIQGRLEQYGFFKVATIMYLITLPGQKGNLLSINLLPPDTPPFFFLSKNTNYVEGRFFSSVFDKDCSPPQKSCCS